jgi:hypothetical protein
VTWQSHRIKGEIPLTGCPKLAGYCPFENLFIFKKISYKVIPFLDSVPNSGSTYMDVSQKRGTLKSWREEEMLDANQNF